jgi:antitoxin component HigA of HigAB toxin-antitoxin module
MTTGTMFHFHLSIPKKAFRLTGLNEHGLSAADLARILGASRNLGAMILRGDRNLTLPHIRKLSAHFKVSPEVFV